MEKKEASKLSAVREVKETRLENECNHLLKNGWKLLHVGVRGNQFIYLLGRQN